MIRFREKRAFASLRYLNWKSFQAPFGGARKAQYFSTKRYTMDGRQTVPTCHAILIGINAYKEAPLRGPVQDVQNIKKYLEGVIAPADIRMYTATRDARTPSSSLIEDPKFWPTDSNIRGAFEELTQSAKAGDHVYIHFSGHGTQEIPNDRSYNKSSGDLALVVLSGDTQNSEKYIFGRSLAYSISAMVQKGLIVALVLDCCFSASVYRSDAGVRFLAYDTEIGSISRSEVDRRLGNTVLDTSASRGVSMSPNWLINPDKYAILVACGPHEEAGEIELPDGRVVGTLSYFLLKILQEDRAIGITVSDVFERLRTEFRTWGRHESPVLYGNKDQGLFGQAIMDAPAHSVIVSEKLNGRLELQAGLAQGVGDGDQFALYPLGISILAARRDCSIARVTHAGAFTSDMEYVSVGSSPGRRRLRARTLSQRSLRKYAVHLPAQLPRVDEVRLVLDERSLDSHTDNAHGPCSFELVLNSDDEYEIYNKSGPAKARLLKKLPNETSPDDIGQTLEHLARFKLVQDLVNTASTEAFRSTFEIYIIHRGNRFGPGCFLEVKEHDRLEMIIRNHGTCDLYVFVYDLGPSLEVANMDRATYTVLAPQQDTGFPRGTYRKTFRTEIPDDVKERHRSCDDFVKVFITSHPTSFDVLELPKLGERAKAGGTVRSSDQGDGRRKEEWLGLGFHIRTSALVSGQVDMQTQA